MGIQVDLLTHGRTCHEKEFIDFEFDGKHVSEFGMVAVFDSDRHSFDGSPEFEDETSQVNGISGQYYWGTRFRTITKNFTLATDGMTEAQVNEFKLHFRPGKYGKFIEDKLAGRYGWARIAKVANFSVVPFTVNKTITVGPHTNTIEMNEYKGSVELEFVFDDPYFYAVRSKIPALNHTIDDLREALLNNLPIDSPYSWTGDGALFVGDGILKDTGTSNKNISSLNFYNPSTAPTKTKLQLTLNPAVSTTTPSAAAPAFFKEIADSVNNIGTHNNKVRQRDTTGHIVSEFDYTSPNIVYQINKTIRLAADYYNNHLNNSWIVLELEEALRLEITNPKVIGWATAILRIMKMPICDFYNSDNDTFNANTRAIDLRFMGGPQQHNVNWFGYFNAYMLCLMAQYETSPQLTNKTILEANWSFVPYVVLFDGYNSETYVNYQYNYIDTEVRNSNVSEEKSGDMVCSSYLKLDGGDSVGDDIIIKTTHNLQFLQNGNPLSVAEVNLEYIYTYL